MESVTSQVYRSVQSYWHRRKYKRLEGLPSKANTKKRVVKLGRGGARTKTNKRSWKVGKILKTVLRFRPKKLLSQLRDAYVDTMLALSGREGLPSSGSRKGDKVEAVWTKRVPKQRTLSVKTGAMNFETRMMLHIYNNMVMSVEARQLTSAC